MDTDGHFKLFSKKLNIYIAGDSEVEHNNTILQI